MTLWLKGSNILKWCLLLILWSTVGRAEEPAPQDGSQAGASQLRSLRIEPDAQGLDRGRLRDSAHKIEVIQEAELSRQSSATLSEFISSSLGVDSEVFCANCGAKRVSINGLKAEHTTLLVDDFPLYSPVSGFYGVDTIPKVGVSRVEIFRGSGLSLSHPEAIGGVVNLHTVDPKENSFRWIHRSFVREQGKALSESDNSFLGTAVTQNQKFGLALGGQFNAQESWDLDRNQVAEYPSRDLNSWFAKSVMSFNSSNQTEIRYGRTQLGILGGSPTGFRPSSPIPLIEPETFFEAHDVRNSFVGDPHAITDVVSVQRQELTLRHSSQITDDFSLRFSYGQAHQAQESIYSHGFDYDSRDDLKFAEVLGQYAHGDHFLTFGMDGKLQEFNSRSHILYQVQGLTPDNFNFRQLGLKILDEWILSDDIELSLGLRMDQLDIRWTELNRGIRENPLSPRLGVKLNHTPHLSSQISYGRGYRVPFTFFETEHGADHYGFEIQTDQMEISDSMVYTFSYNTPTFFVTPSFHGTWLRHSAFAEEKSGEFDPIVFRNSDEEHFIYNLELLVGGYLLKDESLYWQISLEKVFRPEAFQRELPTAPWEERVQLSADWTVHRKVQAQLNLTYIPLRDLRPYGYSAHYNVAYQDTDLMSDTFGDIVYGDQKLQYSKDFLLADLSLEVQMTSRLKLLGGVRNLLDQTQTKSWQDSPSTWHRHGDHFHWDNFHTWGPLRGREFFAGLDLEF